MYDRDGGHGDAAHIQLPDLTGIDMLRTLTRPPVVIFTTAYSAYAVESYTVDAVDYLLKPFSFERFLTAVQKADAQLRNTGSSEANMAVEDLSSASATLSSSITT
jgi:DNA-binding LytR/AlgR family response regulator